MYLLPLLAIEWIEAADSVRYHLPYLEQVSARIGLENLGYAHDDLCTSNHIPRLTVFCSLSSCMKTSLSMV